MLRSGFGHFGLQQLARIVGKQAAAFPQHAALRLIATSSALLKVAEGRQTVLNVASQPQDGSSARPAGYLLLIPSAIAAGLGYWQLERQNWKAELLSRREKSLKGEPADIFHLDDWPSEYLHVVATGTFQYENTRYIGPRPRTVVGGSQIGYTVITPLHDETTHRTILVNRGWVPAQWRVEEQLRQSSEPKGKVNVEGVVMLSEPRSSFVPDNEPERGQWFWVDVPALATSCGLSPDTPLVEVVSAQAAAHVQRGTVPTSMDILAGRTGMPKVAEEFPLCKHMDNFLNFAVMPQDHLNYAITWLALSLATGGMAARAVWGRSRRKVRSS